MNVLLALASPSLARVIEHLLRDETGFELRTCRDAAAAVSDAALLLPDVIVTSARLLGRDGQGASAFRRVIAAEHGHYARVIADMFIDHFLACEFDEIAGEPLETFVDRVYARLDPYIHLMPEGMRWVYPRLRHWLPSYRDTSGIRTALTNMSRRFTRVPRLETATHLLRDARETLHAHFRRFFPEAIAFADRLRLQR